MPVPIALLDEASQADVTLEEFDFCVTPNVVPNVAKLVGS